MNQTNMAHLRIESLYDGVWKLFGFQYDLAVAERDFVRKEIEKRLGKETASEIQDHVAVALGRIQTDDVPNPAIMKMREFYELLAHEKSIETIADRISANASFVDSDDGFLPTLGMSWKDDVLPLLDHRENPGHLAVPNVEKFLRMVRNTEGSAGAISDDVRKRRRELIEFLAKAVKLGEPIWCEL